MIRIWLLRHGKTQGPAALNGITDVAVKPSVQQAIASQLSTLPFTRVISSLTSLRRSGAIAPISSSARYARFRPAAPRA